MVSSQQLQIFIINIYIGGTFLLSNLLLMRESGLLPFNFNQGEIDIDEVILSGFCMANYNIAKELDDSIDQLLMKNKYKILFHECFNKESEKFIMACICDKFHIDEAVINKINYIFEKFFADIKVENDSEVINDTAIKKEVASILNDNNLQELIDLNKEKLDNFFNQIIENKENDINACVLTSSTNKILYSAHTDEFLIHHDDKDVDSLLKGYLNTINLKKIPQGDMFFGLEMLAGLDVVNFYYTGEKTFGLVINTMINRKDEQQNEILLYAFGKNTLMRQYLISIEDNLKEILTKGETAEPGIIQSNTT